MYHRVDDPPWDPWGLAVPPARFREQIAALKKHRVLVSMEDLATGLATGALPPRAAALTFDDGYADNALLAKPILEELEAPATIFVTTGFVRSGQRYWWDRLAESVLAGTAAAEFECAGVQCAWPQQHRLPGDLARWRIGHPATDPRRLAYAALWRALQPMTEEEREAALMRVAKLVGTAPPLAHDRLAGPMTPEMVKDACSDMIAIGVHGRSHVPLTALPVATRRAELEEARAEVAALTGRDPPDGLAYPHGSHDEQTRRLAAAAGYRWAVTSRSARVDPRRYDLLALPRLDPGRRSAGALRLSLHAAAG